jgi:hypothetical protein
MGCRVDDWVVALIKMTPVQRAAELAEDVVAAVEGRAVGQALLSSPISGVPVIGYRVRVDLVFPEGTKRLEVAKVNDFEVEDESGRASVSAAGALLLLGHEYAQDSVQGGSAAGDVLRLLADQVDPGVMRRIPESFTWHEYFLEQRETVYACGLGRHVIDTTQDPIHYRQNAYKPTLCRRPDGRLVIADLHRDELLRTLHQSPWTLSAG